mgnify:CR=1 FL=1
MEEERVTPRYDLIFARPGDLEGSERKCESARPACQQCYPNMFHKALRQGSFSLSLHIHERGPTQPIRVP